MNAALHYPPERLVPVCRSCRGSGLAGHLEQPDGPVKPGAWRLCPVCRGRGAP